VNQGSQLFRAYPLHDLFRPCHSLAPQASHLAAVLRQAGYSACCLRGWETSGSVSIGCLSVKCVEVQISPVETHTKTVLHCPPPPHRRDASSGNCSRACGLCYVLSFARLCALLSPVVLSGSSVLVDFIAHLVLPTPLAALLWAFHSCQCISTVWAISNAVAGPGRPFPPSLSPLRVGEGEAILQQLPHKPTCLSLPQFIGPCLFLHS
jgi:hypothetical protein